MTLKEQIMGEIKAAMKAGDSTKLTTLRGLITTINNRTIEKRGQGGGDTLTEDEVMACIQKEAKKRRESIEAFIQGGRPELADGEKAELVILEAYLPKQMSANEIESIVNTILAKEKPADFGSAMKLVMAELKGKGDAKIISEAVKKKLG